MNVLVIYLIFGVFNQFLFELGLFIQDFYFKGIFSHKILTNFSLKQII